MSADTVVGTVTITGPRINHVTYQTAAWHSEVFLDPGTYELRLDKYGLRARIPGTYASVYTPSQFGGVNIGSQPQGLKHHDVGRRTEMTVGFLPDDPAVTFHANQVWFEAVTGVHGVYRTGGLTTTRVLRLVRAGERIGSGCYWLIENTADITRPFITSEPALLVEIVNEQLAARPDVQPTVFVFHWWSDGHGSPARAFYDHLTYDQARAARALATASAA